MRIPEAQKIEYKSTWQEEYFSWLAGYANSKGGELYVGVNDDGYVIGLDDADMKFLLDKLPNQVTSILGITVGIEHEYVSERGVNVKYSSVPDDIASKPANLYARGVLTKKVLEDIDKSPDNTKDVSEDVKCLFEVAPGFVKQLRNSAELRKKIIKNLNVWEEQNPVNVNTDGTLDYVIVSVASFPYGISYHGRYYIRSGGTTKELNGAELSTFLFKRMGKSWDGLPINGFSISDLDATAIQAYRDKSVNSNRHTREEVSVSDEQIISDLKLIDKSEEGKGQILRGAMLMFHTDPEQYVAGAYIKIAYFAPEGAYGANKSTDIIYHDDVHGPLMTQADKVMDILYTKYLKALISYEGLQRIETFMTPKAVLREVILNAINHKVYESGNPILISVYDDRIIVFNEGFWPFDEIDVDKVYEWHSSYPHNPILSSIFYNSGEIESYGSGFQKIKTSCDENNAPYPTVTATPRGIKVEIRASELYMKLLKHGRYWDTYPEYQESPLMDNQADVIEDSMGDAIITTEKNDNMDKKTLKSVERMSDILATKLNDREKKSILPIYQYLVHNDVIDSSKAMELTGKSSSSVNRYLKKLEQLDVIVRYGGSKNTIYRRV